VHNLVEKREHVVANEGTPPRRHLEQECAQRVEIGARVHATVPYLLGGHVGHSADQCGGAADGGRLCDVRGSGHNAGQAEIEYLGAPTRRDDDIPRLEVTMNDALLVRRLEALGDIECNGAGPSLGEWAVRQRAG